MSQIQDQIQVQNQIQVQDLLVHPVLHPCTYSICTKSATISNWLKIELFSFRNNFCFVLCTDQNSRRQPKPRCLSMICVQQSFEPLLGRLTSHHYFSFQHLHLFCRVAKTCQPCQPVGAIFSQPVLVFEQSTRNTVPLCPLCWECWLLSLCSYQLNHSTLVY